MGWTFSTRWTSGEMLKEHLLTTLIDDNAILGTAFHKTSHGYNLWIAVHPSRRDTPSHVYLFIIERQQDSWGYKDICESMHPYSYDCPTRLLDITDGIPESGSADWRALVRSHSTLEQST